MPLDNHPARASRSPVRIAFSWIVAFLCACSGVALTSPDPVDIDIDAPPVDDPGMASGDVDATTGPSEVVTPCPLTRIGGLESLAGGTFGPDTFLIVTGRIGLRVHLVERRGASLVTLASIRLPGIFISEPTEVVAQRFEDGLLALGERGDRDLALVSMFPAEGNEPAALLARASIALDGQLVSLGGLGSRLWICSGTSSRAPWSRSST
jgi:hypothetical protein